MEWPKKWKDKKWSGDLSQPSYPSWELTEDELRKAFEALQKNCRGTKESRHRALCVALRVGLLSDRKADRALQLLRKEGLIRWTSKDGWEAKS